MFLVLTGLCVLSGGDVCGSSVFPRSDPHVDELGRGSTRSRSRGKDAAFVINARNISGPSQQNSVS